jgi:hypothetical protein
MQGNIYDIIKNKSIYYRLRFKAYQTKSPLKYFNLESKTNHS